MTDERKDKAMTERTYAGSRQLYLNICYMLGSRGMYRVDAESYYYLRMAQARAEREAS